MGELVSDQAEVSPHITFTITTDSGRVYRTRYLPHSRKYAAEVQAWADFTWKVCRHWYDTETIGICDTRELAEQLCQDYEDTFPHVKEFVPKAKR